MFMHVFNLQQGVVAVVGVHDRGLSEAAGVHPVPPYPCPCACLSCLSRSPVPAAPGTGKSVYVKKHLQGGLPEAYTNSLMTFSAQTSANMTQVSRERGEEGRRG